MTKVLFLLSAVVMAVACFFSWQNRQTFVETRQARLKLDTSIRAELKAAEKTANEAAAMKQEVANLAAEVEAEKTRLEQAQIKLRNVRSEADRTSADLENAKKEFANVKSKIEKLPEGVNLETIGESINKQKAIIAENENKARQIQETVAAKEKEVKKAADDLSDAQRRVEERRKLYERNSLRATIVAVNNDWGFVVIDAGKNQEITPDTHLIVTRGTDAIGKLSIISVDGNRTVANIDQKSIRAGTSIAPGDKVILETLYQ